MLNNEETPMQSKDLDVYPIKKRKVYVKPHLEDIGDLRTVTLGPSPGMFESGPEDSTLKDTLD